MWEGLFLQYRECFEKSSEACSDYHYGSALTIFGAIIGRRVHLYYARELYPNFFTILEGPTGISRKTTAMRFGEKVMNAFPDIKRCWGISSAEGLMRVMGGYSPDDGGEKPINRSTILMIEEFATLLRKGKQESLTNLTPTLTCLYDAPSRLDLPTRKRPLVVESPFLSILAGTTPDWLESSLSEEEVMGGFANRFAYIRGKPKPTISKPPKPKAENIEALVADIKKAVSNLKSDYITLSPEADVIWDKHYSRWVKVKRDGIIAEMVQRIPEYSLKCSLVHAIMAGRKHVEAADIERGITFGKTLETNVEALFGAFPLSQWGKTESKIIQLLKEKNPRTKRDIHQHISGRVAADRLARIIQGLESNEIISCFSIGGKTWVKLVKDVPTDGNPNPDLEE